jgi:choline kinase
LRLRPAGESPLLLPANEHKQLVVIDFEYASANLPGLEFANHFTEWCYNYHDPIASHVCNTRNYPTIEEQRRFIRSYVNHRPQFNPRASATPREGPSPGAVPTSSISEFMLDSRAPPSSYHDEERKREQAADQQVELLMQETRIWRLANTAQWVAWGIVQAKLPDLDGQDDTASSTADEESNGHQNGYLESDRLSPDAEAMAEAAKDKRPEGRIAQALAHGEEAGQEADEEDEFDYLGYAQERAMFFWGDVLGLGLMKKEQLPQELLSKVKIVDY